MPPLCHQPPSSVAALSPWQRHQQEWKDCQRCPLHRTRCNAVLGKGRLPCDVLFAGEAPGKSEDALGVPFVGPAGKMLDGILTQALPGHVELGEDGHTEHWVCDLRTFFTNVVACVPINDEGLKDGPPDDDAVRACQPRVVDLVRIAEPRLIVCIGTVATDWLNSKMRGGHKLHREVPMVDVTHPGAIIRAPWAQQSLMRQRAIVVLRQAVEEHVPCPR